MENVREFERETQLLLQKKMGLDGGDDDEDGKFNTFKSIHTNKINKEKAWFCVRRQFFPLF